jgi:hypothetical protein
MRHVKLLGTAMVAAFLVSSPVLAAGGSGGGPVTDPGDPADPGDTPPGDELPPTGGPTPTPGTGTGTPPAAVPVAAGVHVFDLENYAPPGFGQFNLFSAGQSASQTVNGLTLSLTPSAGVTLGLADESTFAYLGVPLATVGHQSAFDFGLGNSIGPIFANFSAGVSDFSLLAYKIAGTYAPVISLTAYSGLNGTGTVLGSTSGSFGGLNYQAGSFSLTGLAGAQSFAFAADTRGNVWFDNFSATATAPVPEPATWAMMVLGFGVAGGAMRRRRSTVRVSYAA